MNLSDLYAGEHSSVFAVFHKQTRRHCWFRADEAGFAEAEALLRKGDGDYYVSRALRLWPETNPFSRGAADSWDTTAAITVDIDIAGPGHSATNLPPDDPSALSLLSDLPRPSVVLNTGGGLLAVWLLERQHTIDDVSPIQRGLERAIQRRAQRRGWLVDTTSAANQVIRWVGGKNHKYKPARDVCVHTKTDRRYRLDDLEAYRFDAPRLRSGRTVAPDGITPEFVADLLRFVPPEGNDYNDWLAVIWTIQTMFDEETSSRLLDEWGTSDWERHSNYSAEPNIGVLIRLARENGWAGSVPAGTALWLPPQLPNARIVNNRFVAAERPTSKIVLLRSAKGTGKTELLTKWLAADESVLAINHRVSLVAQMADRLGLAVYRDGNFSKPRLATTIHSLRRVEFDQQRYRTVVLDESEQIAAAIVTDRNIRRKLHLIAALREVLLSADQIICADADLGGLTIGLLEAIFGDIDDNTVSVDNVYQHKLVDKVFEAATETEWLADLKATIEQGDPVAVACNTKADAKAIEQLVRELYPDKRVVAITSDESTDADHQAFIREINQRVADIDVLIYSPSMGTGVSIDANRFDVVFGLARNSAEGTGTPLDFLQQLSRVRSVGARYWVLYLDPREYRRPTEPVVYYEQLLTREEERELRTIVGQGGIRPADESDRIYATLYSLVKANIARQKNRFRDTIVAELQRAGIERIPLPSDRDQCADAAGQLRSARRKAKDDAIKRIVDADVSAPIDNADTRPEAKAIRAKQALVDKYDLQPDEVSTELVEEDSKGLSMKVTRLAAIQDASLASLLDTQDQQTAPRADWKDYTIFRFWFLQLLAMAGITGVRPGAPVELADNFGAWVWANRDILQAVFDVAVPRNVTNQPLKYLSSILRLAGLRLAGRQERTDDGQRRRRYWLDADRTAWLLDLAARRATSLRNLSQDFSIYITETPVTNERNLGDTQPSPPALFQKLTRLVVDNRRRV